MCLFMHGCQGIQCGESAVNPRLEWYTSQTILTFHLCLFFRYEHSL